MTITNTQLKNKVLKSVTHENFSDEQIQIDYPDVQVELDTLETDYSTFKTNTNTSLADMEQQKANLSYVDTKIGNMGNTKTFKGSVLFANLPTSGNVVDDYYYVSDQTTNYCWNGTSWVDIGNNLNIGDATITPSKTSFIDIIKSANLFNKDNLDNKEEFYLKWDNTEVAYAGVGISHKIYVTEGQTISFFYCASTSANWGLIFDANNNKLESISTIGTSTPFGEYSWQYRQFVVPANASYIKINYTISRKDNAVMCVVGDYPTTEYITYWIKNKLNGVNVDVLDIEGMKEDKLDEKTILTFGDSIMYGAGGSVGGFAKIIADNNNMTLINKALSGATICVNADYPTRGSILKQVEASIANNDTADYILIEGGFNDVFVNSICPLGVISNDYVTFDDTTFCGGLESLFKQALTKWYDKKKLFILGHNIYRSFNDVSAPFDFWLDLQNTRWDLAIEICEKWNMPYIDMRLSGFIPLTDTLLATYFAESNQSTHPNDEGYKLIYTDKVEAKMRSL